MKLGTLTLTPHTWKWISLSSVGLAITYLSFLLHFGNGLKGFQFYSLLCNPGRLSAQRPEIWQVETFWAALEQTQILVPLKKPHHTQNVNKSIIGQPWDSSFLLSFLPSFHSSLQRDLTSPNSYSQPLCFWYIIPRAGLARIVIHCLHISYHAYHTPAPRRCLLAVPDRYASGHRKLLVNLLPAWLLTLITLHPQDRAIVTVRKLLLISSGRIKKRSDVHSFRKHLTFLVSTGQDWEPDKHNFMLQMGVLYLMFLITAQIRTND